MVVWLALGAVSLFALYKAVKLAFADAGAA